MPRTAGAGRATDDLASGDHAAAARTGELGSEGGSYGDLTQTERAARGDSADIRPFGSATFTLVLVGAAVLLVLLVVWFGSSLSELMTAG